MGHQMLLTKFYPDRPLLPWQQNLKQNRLNLGLYNKYHQDPCIWRRCGLRVWQLDDVSRSLPQPILISRYNEQVTQMIFAVLEDWYHHIVLTHSCKLVSFFTYLIIINCFTAGAGFCAHEFIVDCREFKKATGVEVVDIAKRLQDYGLVS